MCQCAEKNEKSHHYQADAGDAGVVCDVGDVEDFTFIITAGLRTCEEGDDDVTVTQSTVDGISVMTGYYEHRTETVKVNFVLQQHSDVSDRVRFSDLIILH